MELNFNIGHTCQNVSIDPAHLLGVLEPCAVSSDANEESLIVNAIHNPIGSKRLSDIVHVGEKIVIVTSDITRPMPTDRVLPFVLNELETAGVLHEDIQVIFANGSHRKHTCEEMKKLVGDKAWGRIRCSDLNTEDLVSVGTTSRGTPVEVDRRVAEADRRICLGNIEYHYFAGYSGGAKAIIPGVAGRRTIQTNHSMMTSENAYAGCLENNPVRNDIEEACGLVGVDFILNVVLDPHKRILMAVAGDVIRAHREGCKFLNRYFCCPIAKQADVVIVSQGGAPKDLNLYQVQKALDNAKHAVKPGGTIILVGSCKEGYGEKVFEEWLNRAESPDQLIERVKEDFQLGGHKAAAIAMVRKKADIYLVSDLDKELAKKAFMKPFDTLQQAYNAAIEKYPSDYSVWAMPFGGSTLPIYHEKNT